MLTGSLQQLQNSNATFGVNSSLLGYWLRNYREAVHGRTVEEEAAELQSL